MAIVSSSPLALAAAMISLTFRRSLSSPLATPMKLGESFSTNLNSVPSCGLRAIMLPATEAPVAMACTWPETKAETVALLSSKRFTSALAGASLVSSMSSIAPRVTPTVLPARSAAPLMVMPLAANTAWKKGE